MFFGLLGDIAPKYGVCESNSAETEHFLLSEKQFEIPVLCIYVLIT